MAMSLSYDEDLGDNPFFATLRKDYVDIFYKAILEGCVICVPRTGSLPNYSITLDDILGHILLPSDEMPESHFNTLTSKEVKICNRVVFVEWDADCQLSIQILFEETYYTEDMLKYKVVCIEHPLEPKPEGAADVLTVGTLRDCIDFINNESGMKNLTETLNKAIQDFLKNPEAIENASLQTLKDLTLGLYRKCLFEALGDRHLKDRCYSNPHDMKTLKISVETYVHHRIYKSIFKCICACTAEDDASINKTIRNCSDLQLKDLEVRAEFHDLIPKAQAELSKLSGYGTVMGKLGCLKKMLAVMAKDPESGGLLAADDLLPIIIFILLQANITNWYAHLKYLKHFRFSCSNNSGGQDEDDFLVTTLEAALEHIDSGVFVSLANSLRISNERASSTLGLLFQMVSNGEVGQVREILESDGRNFSNLNLCHPLCACEKCRSTVAINDPTVDSKDDSGRTALHIAAMYGQAEVMDYLLSQNADLDEVDGLGRTPLHYAAMRGHQSCLLLLLQCGADVNAADNDLNTTLHFCCGFGHLACVKALIYYCEHEGSKLGMNAQNSEGNTPLHNACRWGFLSIIQILVGYQADPSIMNRRKLSSFQVANNARVREILNQSRPKFKCSLSVKTVNFDFLEEGFEKGRIAGEMPLTAKMVKRVEKLMRAIAHGDVNLACFYLGLPENSTKQCHPLCSCSHCKNEIKTPVQSSERVGINMCDSEGYTALHLAVYHGLLELAQILIENGALVNVQTRKLLTPLMIACQQQRIHLVSLLLDSKCAINVQDSKGNTALHYACSDVHSNRRLVECILKHRPKLHLKNKSGRTALNEAEARMSLGIVKLLKDAESI